jgi:hypothetical protein
MQVMDKVTVTQERSWYTRDAVVVAVTGNWCDVMWCDTQEVEQVQVERCKVVE